MNAELKKLHDQRSIAAQAMRDVVANAEAEDRGLNTEEQSSWDNSDSAIQGLDARIVTAKRNMEIDTGLDEMIGRDDANDESRENNQSGSNHQGAFSALMRSTEAGLSGLSQEHRELLIERRALAAGTPAAGGFTVPEGFYENLREGMQSFGGIRNRAFILATETGNNLPIPTSDDTANIGSILAENTGDTEQDLAFNSVPLGAYMYTSKIIRVSQQLLQDSGIDIEALIIRKFAERLGRATAAHYATGTGVGQPMGLVTASTPGITAAATAAITYDELIDLKHSVDPAYRYNATFAFNDSTLRAIKKLKDANGLPLWSAGDITAGEPDRFDGDQYVIDQGIPSMATGARAILYGDFDNYFIRDVRDVTVARMVERYADFHQVGFVAFMRTDAALIDAGQNPVKHLVMA